MTNERTVSVTCVAAIGLWALTFALILAGTVVVLLDHGDYLAIALSLMAHGLACSAAAATVSIRYMLKKHDRFMRAAFELGRDAGPATMRAVRP